MSNSVSSLVPPSSHNGPSLRPRSPSSPKPGYVVQSPDSRVSVHRPSSDSDLDLPGHDPDITYVPNQSDAESDFESVVEITQAEDFVKMLPKKKKKTQPVPVKSRAKGRPRGSGASANLPRAPIKKRKKAVVPVSHSFILVYIPN